jgi:hypothetical protein
VRTGHNRFASTFIGNSFGPDGTVVATYKVRARASFDPGGDTFSGPFIAEFFDLSGNLQGSITGTASAVRIETEL